MYAFYLHRSAQSNLPDDWESFLGMKGGDTIYLCELCHNCNNKIDMG